MPARASASGGMMSRRRKDRQMSVTVLTTSVLDRFHHNGDEFWDGDQTLYELEVTDGEERDSILVVVPRGDAFIAAERVARHVQRLGTTLTDLRSRAQVPGHGRRPQIALPIEPSHD
jgi:hypothetical protein